MTNIKNYDDQLFHIWDQRWKGSLERERLTLLGRMMFRDKNKALEAIVKTLPIQTVMEVGCGLGHTMSAYAELGFNCIGIDASSHAVDVCKQKGLNAVLKKVEDVRESYDLVSCDGLLEHFLHFEPLARHLMRISRRYVLLIQPNHGSFTGKTLSYLDTLLRPDENVYEYNYRINDFISVFQANGFHIIRNHPVFLDVFRVLLFEREGMAVMSSSKF